MHHHPRRKGAALLAAGAAATLLLSACGGSGDDTVEDGGDVTLTFWSWNPSDETVGPYIDAFEAEHDNITIDHRFIQYSDYVNTTQLALQSGSGPDVFGLQVGALTNQFAPLAEDLTPYIEEELGSDWSEQLTSADQLRADEKQVALPWMVTGGGLVWANQTLIDELGLTVPTTFDELTAFCGDIRAEGLTCMAHGGRDAWQNIDVYQAIINQIAPGEFYTALAGESDFTSEPFVEAFEVWQSLFTEGIFDEGALGLTAYPDANDAFKQGEAALIAFGTWQNADTTTARMESYAETYGSDFDTETVFMPYFFPEMVPGGETGTLFGGPDVGFAVSSASDVTEEAASFVTWLTAGTSSQELMAATVQQPALASVPLDVSDVMTAEQEAALEAQAPALENMVGQREIDDADVRTALGDALSAVASDQQTPQDAVAAVQAAIDTSGQ
ncbi:ABC transporter substrate-binding protein [Ruania alba]|uniref:Carbohydrate ABC transporter substrate-binding protein, CUT1 family n=1 Tax=Ruania alba TaxID=648782 RepID=A0A1H5GXU7_9MICO|nr:extracellular solute-binding protein [Ruania alba]SEE20445.1 carbohydrate ABC transporter substrate-binding protein, CUT1 family [Ruania alba]